jgi:NADH-quinone oxidoreductase subunit L
MRNEANKGALKAVVVNRVGDVFFMFALGLMWVLFKSFDFDVVFHLYPEYVDKYEYQLLGVSISAVSLVALCLFIAACAKSAQFLLHLWLPDAMEGPTPVSSLLHSATMVTAGIYLIIRSSFIFSLTPHISTIMAILGVFTAIISGFMGLSQYDLKRIIAYSTCSQLGFMILACGLGYYHYAFFHLITHAFFKCLLFLCSGTIIHAVNDEQDIRFMGGLAHRLPITFACMTIGTLALTGFPFLAGYYSKDLILEALYTSNALGPIFFALAGFAAFLTSFYSIRVIYFVFFRRLPPVHNTQVQDIIEASYFMTIPMIILTIFSIISGYLFQDVFAGVINIWGNSIAFPVGLSLTEHEYIPFFIKSLPTILGTVGLLVGSLLFFTPNFYFFKLFFYSLMNLTTQKLYIDYIYNCLIAVSTAIFGYLQYTLFDRGYLETFGPYGLTTTVRYLRRLFKLHNGFITHYLLLFFTAFLIYLLLSFFINFSFTLLAILFLCYLFI